MIEWIESLPTAGSGLIVVGGFIVLTLAIGWIVAKVAPNDVRIEHNDLAGFILAVIGVVYAVLLAFVAIGVWERFQHSEELAYAEAGSLTVVYRDAGSFPQGERVRRDLRDYVNAIENDEWPLMARGRESEKADLLIEKIDKDVRDMPAESGRLQNIQAQMLVALDEALKDRDVRISASATGINSLMWGILMLGAVLTVGFTYLFGFRHTTMQHLMIGSLGALIGLVLFLTIALDYPFRGSIAIQPEAFHHAQETFTIVGP